MNLESVLDREFPTPKGAVLVLFVQVIAINLVADVAYGWVDPRIRHG